MKTFGLGLLTALALVGAAAAQPAPAAYDGLKKTVAVDTFQAPDAFGGAITADGLTAMLTDALVRDGRFVVVERPGLSSVQAEQQLGESGAATAETAAHTGQLIGASAIIRGTVTKYEANAGGSSLGVGGLPIGGILGGRAGVSKQKSLIEISLRLVDTTTGQVVSTSKAHGVAATTSADASLVNPRSGASMDASTFHKTPIGQAGEQAIQQAVEQIAAGMRTVPWSALVIETDGAMVYLNAGADRNVQPGLTLNVFHKGKTLTDPSTGEVLDVEMSKVGAIKVDAVRDKVSTAEVVDGGAPQRGDLLRLP